MLNIHKIHHESLGIEFWCYSSLSLFGPIRWSIHLSRFSKWRLLENLLVILIYCNRDGSAIWLPMKWLAHINHTCPFFIHQQEILSHPRSKRRKVSSKASGRNPAIIHWSRTKRCKTSVSQGENMKLLFHKEKFQEGKRKI